MKRLLHSSLINLATAYTSVEVLLHRPEASAQRVTVLPVHAGCVAA